MFLLENVVQRHPEDARGVPVQHQVLFGPRADVGPLGRVITPVPIPGETPPRIAQSQQPAHKTVREISYHRNTRHYFYFNNLSLYRLDSPFTNVKDLQTYFHQCP